TRLGHGQDGGPRGGARAGKPSGRGPGDGVGAHACDSANAGRNMARVATPRHTVACLILAAFQAARDRSVRPEFLTWEPYPRADAREKVKTTDPDALLRETEAAIKEKDQARTCALVQAYGAQNGPARAMFDLLV